MYLNFKFCAKDHNLNIRFKQKLLCTFYPSFISTLCCSECVGLISPAPLFQGFKTIFRSLKDLSDAPASIRETEMLKQTCMAVKGVISVEEIKARKSGPYLYVEVTVGVDGNISASAAHRLVLNFHLSFFLAYFYSLAFLLSAFLPSPLQVSRIDSLGADAASCRSSGKCSSGCQPTRLLRPRGAVPALGS